MDRKITKDTKIPELRLRLFQDGYERFMDRASEIKRDALRGQLNWTSEQLKSSTISAAPYERIRNAMIVRALKSGNASAAAKTTIKGAMRRR